MSGPVAPLPDLRPTKSCGRACVLLGSDVIERLDHESPPRFSSREVTVELSPWPHLIESGSLLFTVHVPNLILSFASGLLIPVLPLFVGEFGIGYGLIGLALAGEAIGTLVTDLPAGILLRQFDRKWVMVVGVALVGGSVLALVWTSAVWQVILLRIFAGAGSALWNLSRHAFITEVTHLRRRGRELALFGGLSRAGMFVGPAVGGLVAGVFGLRSTFLLHALLAAVVLGVAFAAIRRAERRPAVRSSSGTALARVFRDYSRVLAPAGLGQLLAQTIRAGRRVIIPLYGADVLGLGVEAVGWVVSAAALLDMAMFYPAGLVMDRFGRKYAIVPSFLIQGIGMALIPVAGSFAGLLVVGGLIGIGNGLGSGSMMTLGADLAPKEALGEFLGIWRLIGDSGSSTGPLFVGIIAAAVGLSLTAPLIGVIGLGAATIFTFRVPETLRA